MFDALALTQVAEATTHDPRGMRIGVGNNVNPAQAVRTAFDSAVVVFRDGGFTVSQVPVPFSDPAGGIASIEADRQTIGDRAFRDVDVILLPTLPTTVPTVEQVAPNPEQGLSAEYTVFANQHGLPAITVPCTGSMRAAARRLAACGQAGRRAKRAARRVLVPGSTEKSLVRGLEIRDPEDPSDSFVGISYPGRMLRASGQLWAAVSVPAWRCLWPLHVAQVPCPPMFRSAATSRPWFATAHRHRTRPFRRWICPRQRRPIELSLRQRHPALEQQPGLPGAPALQSGGHHTGCIGQAAADRPAAVRGGRLGAGWGLRHLEQLDGNRCHLGGPPRRGCSCWEHQTIWRGAETTYEWDVTAHVQALAAAGRDSVDFKLIGASEQRRPGAVLLPGKRPQSATGAGHRRRRCGGGAATGTSACAAPRRNRRPAPGTAASRSRSHAGRPDRRGLPVFPSDNEWNRPVAGDPVDASSASYIAAMNGGSKFLHPDFGGGGVYGIPWISVPGHQPRVTMKFEWDDESDPGPYPFPMNAPIEGGPDSDGDRHVLVRRSGQLQAVRDVRFLAGKRPLERLLGRRLRSAVERAPAAGLDQRRRRRAAGAARSGPPGRGAEWSHRPRSALHRGAHAAGLRPSGDPLRQQFD